MPLHPRGESVLRPLYLLQGTDVPNQIYERTKQLVVAAAELTIPKTGPDALVLRSTRPNDIGETNAVWAETVSATGNDWEDSQIAAQAVSDDRVIGLYGVCDLSDYQAVTGIRISTGGVNRVAEWDLFPLLPNQQFPLYRTGIAMSHIIIPANINITIQYYNRQGAPMAARGVELVILGITCEKVGRILQP